jgi:uncharacterized membrane protein YedE/YeeE
MIVTSWILPLLGGLLIGISASLFLWLNGRVAGISNIVGGLWSAAKGDSGWRWFFIIGLLCGGLSLAILRPESFGESPASLPKLALAGFLVGFGARLGNGCTSGHGVCGLSRRSFRSLVATLVFMVTAMFTVYLFKHKPAVLAAAGIASLKAMLCLIIAGQNWV